MKKILFISALALLAAGCNPNQPAQTPVQQTTPAAQTPSYTMAEVQSANTPEKCWTAINGNVYNLTAFINKHPGGDKNILSICGKDGSAAYKKQHGGESKQENILKGFEIGKLK